MPGGSSCQELFSSAQALSSWAGVAVGEGSPCHGVRSGENVREMSADAQRAWLKAAPASALAPRRTPGPTGLEQVRKAGT